MKSAYRVQVGKIDLYKYVDGNWTMFKSGVTLSQADSNIKYNKNRLVAVHNGIVVAASIQRDLNLAFDEVETITL
jgi:hypothetical protein